MKNYSLIILDRDGVINQDSDAYVKSVDEWIPLSGSLEAIAQLNAAGYKVAVCTNQSGVARSYFDIETLNAMHEKMATLLMQQDGHVDAIFFCPHGPDDSCDCRKPKPGMYEHALEHFQITSDDTLVIGDSLRDIQAAHSIGADAALVLTGKGEKTLAKAEGLDDVEVFADLADVVSHLLYE
tara:strand:+ start:15629 stop:16174 length:546 start_codon:yes stop_codon:yes gene_type:complete